VVSAKAKNLRAIEFPPEAHEASKGYPRLWKLIKKLTDLRNAAAHKNYESERDALFKELANLLNPGLTVAASDQEALLNDVTEICAGILLGMLTVFSNLRQRS
jgi:hypothetical protein